MKKCLLLLLVLLTVTIAYRLNAQTQQPAKITVTGTVVSGETKQPLTGASIAVKGSKKGVVSDAAGKFTIKVDKGQTIVVSFAGFEAQEFKINEAQNLPVALNVSINENEEVVVIGYGTRKKSHLTGAIAKINNDNLGQIPVSRADQALQGKLAGVNIVTTDAQAGAAPTIQIRGATSITAGTDPLIVIDGYPVPTDLSAIDMNDVESIEVLKDAASAAIYGSRGGNGVILITTKSGKIGKGKISVNVYTGVKNAYRTLKFPTLQEWRSFVEQDNNGVIPDEVAQAARYNTSTDVQDFILRQVNYTSLQLGVSGGTTNFRYYLSANGLLDDGVYLGNDYKRLGMRAGFNAKVSPKVSIDFGFTPSYTVFYKAPVSMQEALRSLPNWMPAYHNDSSAKYTGLPVGSVANMRDFNPGINPNYTGINLASGTGNSPISQLTGITDKNTQIRNISNFAVKVELAKNLSFRSSVNFLIGERSREFFQRSWAQTQAIWDGDIRARASAKVISTRLRTIDISNENILNYKKLIKKHDIDIVAGITEQYTHNSSFSGQVGNLPTDQIPTLNAGTMQILTGTDYESSFVSTLFRFNYAYANKYLLSLSIRNDGSSRFGTEKRWSYFPAASLGWRVSNEKFFPENRILTDLKLRASYGVTGNANIPDYKYLALVDPVYASLGNEITPGFQLITYGNPNLGWERTISTNIGGDFSLFNNKLQLTVEYYNTKTDKLLLDLPIAASTGLLTYPINRGKVGNTGFEFEISTTVLSKKNFKWTVSANGYTNKNKLLDFGGTQQQINQGDPSRANFFLARVGEPLVQYYGYQATSPVGIRNTNYWPIGVSAIRTFVQDQTKDGVITDADRVVLGNPYPKFLWGFTSNFQYKSFDISVTLQGSHGAKVFNIDPYYFETQFSTTGSQAHESQGYTAEQLASLRLKSQTDVLIQDASFVALRNLNVGYSFSTKAARKMGLNKVRIYMTTANLWYYFPANYSSYNPEADNGFPNDPLRKGYQRGAAPITRNITFGLNVEF